MTARTAAPGSRTGLHRVVGWTSCAIALLLAILPPAVYFEAALVRTRASVDAEARVIAAGVAEVAARNPALWTFETLRLSDVIARASLGDENCHVRIEDAEGVVATQTDGASAWPAVSARIPFDASGVLAGAVVVRRSLHGDIANMLMVGGISSVLAALAYVLLRRIPERALDQALAKVSYLATHDVLTGLPNRALFMDRLSVALAETDRDPDVAIAVLCLDLDRFKEVNDTLGHATGDALLRAVSARLHAELRQGDTLARLGGDEFAIIQHAIDGPKAPESLAERLIAVVDAPFDLGEHQVLIGTSVGIALARGRGSASPDTLLADADTALYAAKRQARGTFRFFADEMNTALRARRAMEADLRVALRRGEFELLYQPQVAINSGEVIGLEALLRWNHPERGLVTPDAFIPLAEEIGLLPEIGAWVLRQACTAARRWETLRIAVNVSAHQIHTGGFETLVARALQENGLPGHRLEIEITEGVLLTQTAQTIRTLERIHDLGVSIAMDDFGTGYSSLGYLQRFRFDKLKIDRSFIAALGSDTRASAIVDAVLGISRALGVRVNAEGVETAAQASLLAARGCEEAQGWLYGKPLPVDAIDSLLAAPRPTTDAVVAETA